ncbi:vWA domain-containing protein [Verrucomicrobiota bacterium sgz303538]
MIEFGQPLWFWALALLPLLIAIFFRNERQRTQLLQKLVAARLAGNLAGGVSVGKRRFRFALLLVGLACVIVSLAQPRWGYTWQERKTRGRDVLIAIDVSRSMLANDLAPNRLTRAKLAAEDLVAQLGGDRVGLIAFAGSAFLQAPLTADHSAVLSALHELDPEIIPRGGTNIAEAVRTAVEAFGKGESDNRALVIFTDGEELDADGIKAASEQKEIAKIFTVGVGSTEGTVIALPGRSGDTDYVKDSQGQIVKSRLDEERLRAIAEATGGFYLHLQNGPAEMRQLVRDGLGSMNEKDINAEFARQPIERYQWPLGAGMVLLVGSMLIGERRKAIVRAQPKIAAWVLGIGMALVSSTLRAETPTELYDQGRYKEAQDAYAELLRRNPDSDRLAFNHGAAAYKNRDFKSALESFGKAVASEDRQLRARAEYNLGNTLFQQATSGKKGPDIKTLESALSHFDQARQFEAERDDAQHNYDVTKQLIEQLKQKPPESQQQQKKDKDQNKDQKDQQQDQQQSQGGKDEKDKQEQQQSKGNQQDQQQQNQQSGQDQKQDQGQKGQQSKDGKEEQNEQKEGKGDKEKQQDAQGGQKEKRDQKQQSQGAQSQQDGKEGEQPSDAEKMSEQQNRKLEGELKNNPAPGGEESKEEQAEKEAAEEALAAAEGRMTEAQAKALLDSLKSEDRNVRLLDPQAKRQRERPLRDW